MWKHWRYTHVYIYIYVYNMYIYQCTCTYIHTVYIPQHKTQKKQSGSFHIFPPKMEPLEGLLSFSDDIWDFIQPTWDPIISPLMCLGSWLSAHRKRGFLVLRPTKTCVWGASVGGLVGDSNSSHRHLLPNDGTRDW